jgi:hypothetical protein
MAIGDVTIALSPVADDGYLDIQPGPGVEWVIHNILAPIDTAVELYLSNGTNEIKVDEHSAGFVDVHFHCTNSIYYRIKNVSGATAYLGYDGVVTK